MNICYFSGLIDKDQIVRHIFFPVEKNYYTGNIHRLPISQWNNYVVAWTEAELGTAFLNSIYVTILSLIATILLAAMASYVLARLSFLGNRFFYYLFTAGMIFPLFCFANK